MCDCLPHVFAHLHQCKTLLKTANVRQSSSLEDLLAHIEPVLGIKMSMTPMPVHMSCFGVSSEAVNMARGYSKLSYSDRLATVKSSLVGVPVDTVSAASCSKADGTAAGGHRAVGTTSPARQVNEGLCL